MLCSQDVLFMYQDILAYVIIRTMAKINYDKIEYIDIIDDNLVIKYTKTYIRDALNPFEFFNEKEFKAKFQFAKNTVQLGILIKTERGLPIAPVNC